MARFVILDRSIALHFVVLACWESKETVLYLPDEKRPQWLLDALSETPRRFGHRIRVIKLESEIRAICPKLNERHWII